MVEVMKEEERMEGVEVGCGEDGSGECAAGRARSSSMGGMRACGAMLVERSSHAGGTIVSCWRGRWSQAATTIVSS